MAKKKSARPKGRAYEGVPAGAAGTRRPDLQVGRRTGERKPGQRVSDLLPDRPTLASVREAATDCKACDLYKRGTQTVFGEGPRRAEIMMVGEQPGDAEDLAGHPFVGPAGRLLDHALEEAGIADLKKVAAALTRAPGSGSSR